MHLRVSQFFGMRRRRILRGRLQPAAFVLLVVGSVGIAPLLASETVATTATDDSFALQFPTSDGHVLGFGTDSVVVASSRHMLRVEFVGTDPVTPVSQDHQPGATGELEEALPVQQVTYSERWPGVSVTYDVHPGSLFKNTYTVEAGLEGSPTDQIQLRYNRPVRLDEHGNLIVSFETGAMTESAPVAWQDIAGSRVPVPVSWKLLGEDEVGFRVGDYAPEFPLVIDPTLTWMTFLGQAGNDYGTAIAVDGSGNVYVAGWSDASWGSPVRAHGGGTDAYIAKLDTGGNLLWNSFLGGSGSETLGAIDVDAAGNVLATGNASATWGLPIRAYGGMTDAYVAKVTSGGSLVWNTFLGSVGANDSGLALAANASGNVVAGGFSSATWGTPVRPYAGAGEAFVAGLNSSGTLVWNTFLGAAANSDSVYGLFLDNAGSAFAVGNSSATWGTPIRAYSSSSDVIVAKLDGSGNLVWNTFLGGGSNDYGESVVVDGFGDVLIAGRSAGTWGSPVRAYTSSNDGLAAKLTAAGSLVWNTFLGGGSSDSFDSVDVDGSGNVFLAGRSTGTWGSPDRAYSGSGDGLAVGLTSTGTLLWNTFLGGTGSDYGKEVRVDSGGTPHVAGYSSATWGSPLLAHSGGNDGFAVQIGVAPTYSLSGTVFEDANFNGTAENWDGGTLDLALEDVDVELYDADDSDAFVASTLTNASGVFTFAGLSNGNYKVRARSTTIGDVNTPPAGGLNGCVGVSCPYPLPEMTWGNTATRYGGASATASDLTTPDDNGPGDTWVAVNVADANVTDVNLGFAYNLIMNTFDDTNGATVRSTQGSLRQFVKNANAIGAAASTTASSSYFRIPISDPNHSSGLFTITLLAALPTIADAATTLDATTQTTLINDSNLGEFVHPLFGSDKDVGTGPDGVADDVEGVGDEPVLPSYNFPEIEIDGGGFDPILELAAGDSTIKGFALVNTPSGYAVVSSAGTGNEISSNFIGVSATGTDPVTRINGGIELTGGEASLLDNLLGYSLDIPLKVVSDATVRGNELFAMSEGTVNDDAISVESTTGQTIVIEENRIHEPRACGVESWSATGPYTIQNNTVWRAGRSSTLR